MLVTNFKSDVWKHFGFTVSRNEKRMNVTDRKQSADAADTRTNTHLRHFLAHIARFKVQSLFNKRQLHFYSKSLLAIKKKKTTQKISSHGADTECRTVRIQYRYISRKHNYTIQGNVVNLNSCDESEPSHKVCETAAAPAAFKPDVWKCFGFILVGKTERRKGDGQTVSSMQTMLD